MTNSLGLKYVVGHVTPLGPVERGAEGVMVHLVGTGQTAEGDNGVASKDAGADTGTAAARRAGRFGGVGGCGQRGCHIDRSIVAGRCIKKIVGMDSIKCIGNQQVGMV
jgi:hypothetical protein